MAYDVEEEKKKALAAIKRYKLIYVEEIANFIKPARTWIFENLNESDDIKRALEANKITGKLSSRQRWADSDNATLQIAYYKLLATEDELKRLSGQYIDHTSKGKEMPFTGFNFLPGDSTAEKEEDTE